MDTEEYRARGWNLSKSKLNGAPRLKKFLRPLYDFVLGLPPVSHDEMTKELVRECVGRPDPTILEIGCNDGEHTLWFLEIFENPTVHCFEPDPRAAARFKNRIGQRSNVSLYEIALSDRNGEVAFYQSGGLPSEQLTNALPEGWDLSGSIRKPKHHLTMHPWATFERSITVRTATLDDWCAGRGIEKIDFIWMDVQGAEIDVIRGGKSTLAKTRFVYSEYSNFELYQGQATLRQLLQQLKGFQPLVRYPNDVLLANKQLELAFSSNPLHQMLVDSHRKV